MRNVVQAASKLLPQRLYSSGHQFITYPVQGVSYLGISDYAKRCIVPEIVRYRITDNAAMRQSIRFFQGSFLSTKQHPTSLFQHIPERLIIRKDQTIMAIETKDSDVSIVAPVDLRVIRLNSSIMVDYLPKTAFDWLMQVEIVDKDFASKLLSQQEYVKMWKSVDYE